MFERTLVPQEMLSPGFEAVYTGETSTQPVDSPGWPTSRYRDASGKVFEKWSLWTWQADPAQWDAEIRAINSLQERLGPLDNDTRQIRAHIGSLVLCEPGIPATIDDLLAAIGRGRFLEPPLHNGCWCPGMWWQNRGTQHGGREAMTAIEQIVLAYLDGRLPEEIIQRYPNAASFIRRVVAWLPPRADLAEIQRMLLERMLLPFEFFTGRSADYAAVNFNCFEEGGRGAELDHQISALAGLPPIYPITKVNSALL